MRGANDEQDKGAQWHMRARQLQDENCELKRQLHARRAAAPTPPVYAPAPPRSAPPPPPPPLPQPYMAQFYGEDAAGVCVSCG